jgi:hypothetical protein
LGPIHQRIHHQRTFVTLVTPRTIAPPLLWARASPPVFTKARGHNPYSRAGLAFERKVKKALTSVARSAGATLEPNPWFTFRDANGDGVCSPDAILNLLPKYVIVVEVKLKYVLGAEAKLKGLYLPVVARARDLPISHVFPLIITKVLTKDASGLTIEYVGDAITSQATGRFRPPVLHWLGSGDEILWNSHAQRTRVIDASAIAI